MINVATLGSLMKKKGHSGPWLTGFTYRKAVTVTANGTVSGTIAVVNTSNGVTGTGTAFTAWNIGDEIKLPDGTWKSISTINSDTYLTISGPYTSASASGESYNMRHVNYQTKILVGKSSSASGESVDCNDHCLATFADLRFTKADGTTELSYWIESITGSGSSALATVWVECGDIADTGSDIYMYYGKADATTTSNGANTFPFFDHFDGASLDTDLWVASAGDATSLSDSILTLQRSGGAYCYGQSTYKFGVGYALRMSVKLEDAVQWAGQEQYQHTTNSKYLDAITKTYVYNATGSSYNEIAHGVNMTSAFRIFDIVRTGIGTYNRTKLFVDGVEKTNSTTALSGASTSLRSAIYNTYEYSSSLYSDWCLYRKCCYAEPTFGAWGSEES